MSDLFKIFTSLSGTYLRTEEEARKKLAQCMTELDRRVDTSLIREAMKAAAMALPYRTVLKDAETAGIREALKGMRETLTRQLLTRTPGHSTCPITNEAALMEIEAAQSFLANTDGILDYAEDAPEQPAPAPEPQPAPAPAPVEVPKVTPAQRRTLEAIRDNGVKFQEFSVGTLMVRVERGTKPRRDMVEWVIKQGWAKRDTSHSLFHGQPVVLTRIGEAILAG
ncbi:hypothetical protein ACFOOM_01035 [Streptomyces echinoruber]|uniref:Uncharacterized protein n=1 Tax=Streptomyces echinoruber TaxID=68898 RepID=A0A918QVW4_9ACTN|nr:hypothetical protein [Streptomyces echinoruber]GGZ73137.1 hypothetical protein GCM10010389_08270 [Streptomyces echinoruber]